MIWSTPAGACPSCGHMPAWHDAGGCRFPYPNSAGSCICARTLGETGVDGGR